MRGLVFWGNALTWPSHLWMRRMLEEVDDCVTTLITTPDSIEAYRQRFRCICLGGEHRHFISRALSRGLRICRMPLAREGADLLMSVLQAKSTDVVLVHYIPRALEYENVWRRCRKRVFVHCHGHDVTWNKRSDQPGQIGRAGFAPDYVNRVRRLSECVYFIANSFRTRERLLSIGVQSDRIVVKYLGVEIPSEPPTRSPTAKSVTILYLGNLVDCKGPDLVLRAFDVACSRGLRGRLIVAGDGALRMTCELIRARSRYQDRIIMLGAVDSQEGERLRHEADVFTAHNCLGPIRHQEEAFGVSIVEAMAAALPVVTGRSGGVVETVENGMQGILVEPEDVEAHAEAFLKLEREPDRRVEMGLQGWKRAKELFSIEKERDELRRLLGLPPYKEPTRSP